MGLTLLFPLGLAALAAWLVPLLVHLARRQESRLTEFAALRWLRAQPRPRQRIRIDEWPLLLVRLLLLALLALLLAALAWRDDDDHRPRVLVAPGIEATAQRALRWPQDARVHWLARGFPALDTPVPAGVQPVASLLREFDAQLPPGAPLTVVVPSSWGAVDAQRPVLSRPVQWQVLPGASPPSGAMAAAPPRLAVFAADENSPAWRTLRALQSAWRADRGTAALPRSADDRPDAALLPAGTLAVRLRGDALPPAWLEWVRGGGEVLIASGTPWPAGTRAVPQWQDDAGRVVLASAPLGRGRLWQLPEGLDPATSPRVREAGFATDLALALRPPVPPARVSAADFAPAQQPRSWPRAAQPLAPLLALLIALVFALERWMATAPRRSAAA
ncbi:BatA domain-containing protein [Stenotrophomonas sp. HITSZ_GD]|uniref:BatA domain-containing protein n=1 Tax=Stenotrophomonas sp. HITSZ_GD TaxID=3037248 RepID=UPI00240D5A2E|nr:BatA domain-containing protein [Stenotrophomonas sp. HITSZ_GD]MDG2524023.1 BatA domain-containing protein [Stenotrophomonas sp. HITSZ_GD]